MTLNVILFTKNESLASLEYSETLGLGFGALELEYDLFGLLGLLSEDWLSLSTETRLLGIISSLSLSKEGIFTLLVLRDLVDGVLKALLAVSFHLLGYVDLSVKKLILNRTYHFAAKSIN